MLLSGDATSRPSAFQSPADTCICEVCHSGRHLAWKGSIGIHKVVYSFPPEAT